MREQWRTIPSYAGLYEASNLGNIRRAVKQKGAIRNLTPTVVRGYARVNLYDQNFKQKQYFVHRLVYEAFKGIIPADHEIHHKDNNPLNNSLKNLKLTTRAKHPRTNIRTYPEACSCEKIKVIRAWHQTGIFTMKQLCQIFQMNYDRLAHMVNYRTFKQC